MNPENHEKANLRQNPRESHDMTTSSTARAERTEELNPYAIVQRQCDNAARYLSEFDPGLFEFLKRPDKLTIVEFPISTELWRGHKHFVGYRCGEPVHMGGSRGREKLFTTLRALSHGILPGSPDLQGLSVVIQGFGNAGASRDPEVVDKPLRRRFAPSYKLRIVEEADRCTEFGEVGRLLRREGLYSSHLTTWRKAARSGSLKALSKKRGRKRERNPLEEKVRKLERENTRLEKELHKAHLIIDVQGKVAGLLGLSLEDGTHS